MGRIKGIVIAGTHSSAGKTTVSLALMAAFRARGLAVQAYKVGPDFIDPGHHSLVSGRLSRNLDGWMLSRQANLDQFRAGLAAGGRPDLALVEGVMGLFDGLSPEAETGSTAEMAKWLGLPVFLVVEAKGMSRSAAALVLGFKNFDPELNLAGVILNRVAGPNHVEYLRPPIEAAAGLPVIGALARDDQVALAERHLGLTTAEETPWDQAALDRLARLAEEGLDLDRVLDLAGRVEPGPLPGPPAPVRPRATVGVARDEAFCFYYQANLEALQAAGAELVFFSPLAGEVPRDVDGLYLGGGYPELQAERLAGQAELKAWLNRAAREGLPVYAECGGFMYLGKRIIDLDGRAHDMAGLLPVTTRMDGRLRALGYREVELQADCLLGRAGDRIRGHEFHYSHLIDSPAPAAPAYRVNSGRGGRTWDEGWQAGSVLGSYVHLHFLSQPRLAESLVAACQKYREGRGAA